MKLPSSFKITEVRVSAGKDSFVLTPTSMEFFVAGQRIEIEKEIAKTCHKAVADQVEKWFKLFKK